MSTVSRKEIRFTKKEFAIVCLILMTIFSLFTQGGWLIYHDGPYTGKVVDEETNQPIEGSAIVALWYIQRYGGAGGPVAKLLEAKEAVTNKNGEFTIPSMIGFHWWPFSTLDEPNVIVFKPGYRTYKDYNYQPHERVVIQLPKATTKKQRMDASSFDMCETMNDYRCMIKLPYTWKLREQEWKDLDLMK